MERHILLATIAAVTVGAAAAATFVSLRGRSPGAQLVAERLARVAILGMGALVAILSATAL